MSKFNENNEYLEGVEGELVERMAEAEIAVEQTRQLENEIQKLHLDIQEICRYYDTSSLMLNNLIDQFTEKELANVLSCTNQKCFDIMDKTVDVSQLCKRMN
uniref:hypothetical protein n=1 Tax=Thaumasiovibrio occultus TaxID=1891184 RepID=UPI00131C6A56|nr:hypothetical protein [Thaumasiovibrio occultus]